MEFSKEDFPQVAIYRKPKNRILFSIDFEDGEIIKFDRFALRPNAWKEGLAFYKSKKWCKLVNIKNLEEVKLKGNSNE